MGSLIEDPTEIVAPIRLEAGWLSSCKCMNKVYTGIYRLIFINFKDLSSRQLRIGSPRHYVDLRLDKWVLLS